MKATYGRFTVVRTKDADEVYWVVKDDSGVELDNFEMKHDAIAKAERLAEREYLASHGYFLKKVD